MDSGAIPFDTSVWLPPELDPSRPPRTSARHQICQFMIGHPRRGRYCGAPTKPRSAYCPAHHAKCVLPRGTAQ